MTDEPQSPAPDLALMRLDRLVGTWQLTGRTQDASADNITGRVVIEWLPGGFFQLQRGELKFMGTILHSLEIIGYDPGTGTFPATVYSSLEGTPVAYQWDVQGSTVTHWTSGSKYTGTLSADGRTLTGGWRPDPGQPTLPENTYDATMTRVA